MANISKIKLPSGVTYDVVDNTSGYITGYTETDPVFSASPAASITSEDISNWNAKVSDDKTWNRIQLNISSAPTASDIYYIPSISSIFDTEAKLLTAIVTPTARKIPLYDSNAYLNSTTPLASDNSTKVATTEYVTNAISTISIPTKTSDLTNDSGFITSSALSGYLPLTGGTLTGSLNIQSTALISGDLTIGTNTVISDTQASSLSQTLKVVVPTDGAKSIILQRDDGSQDIRLHLSSAGNRGLYDNVTKHYLIYHDANDVLRLYTAPSLLGHNSPIGTVIADSQSNVSIATGGSLKGTGCSVVLPKGTWIIQYYVGWQNTNGGSYKGIGLRYRNVGVTSWTAMTRSNINVQPIQSDTAVHDTLAGCVVVTVGNDAGVEHEINVRNNVAGTVNCDLRAVRLL